MPTIQNYIQKVEKGLKLKTFLKNIKAILSSSTVPTVAACSRFNVDDEGNIYDFFPGQFNPPNPAGTSLSVDMAGYQTVAFSTANATGTVDFIPSNPVPGRVYTLIVSHGATPRSIRFPTGTTSALAGGRTIAPSGANRTDMIFFQQDDKAGVYRINGVSPNQG